MGATGERGRCADVAGARAIGEYRSAWTAVVVALVLLLLSGGAYRVLAWRLGRAGNVPAVAPGTLAALPLVIGDWVGVDEPVEPTLARAADVDDYVSRRYQDTKRRRAVRLWIAFGGRARDLMPHRPEVCYPGAGWTLVSKQTAALTTATGESLSVRVLRFSPGPLNPRQLLVLNYYIVEGQTWPDVSGLRARAWRGQAAVRYIAQVQIVSQASGPAGVGRADKAVRAFGAESFPLIRALLAQAVGLPAGGKSLADKATE